MEPQNQSSNKVNHSESSWITQMVTKSVVSQPVSHQLFHQVSQTINSFWGIKPAIKTYSQSIKNK